MRYFSSLRQARKNIDLSLQDAAFILDMDISNLSKCEHGKMQPTIRCLVGYKLITKTPLRKLLRMLAPEIRKTLLSRTEQLLKKIESSNSSETKNLAHRKEVLRRVISNLSNDEVI